VKALSQIREENGWSVDELARKAKIKNRTIEKIESENLSYIDFQEIIRLKEFLQVEDFEEINTFYRELYSTERKR